MCRAEELEGGDLEVILQQCITVGEESLHVRLVEVLPDGRPVCVEFVERDAVGSCCVVVYFVDQDSWLCAARFSKSEHALQENVPSAFFCLRVTVERDGAFAGQ